ncbi:MAG: DUF1385 domain-containing protein [Clostridia bacterium]|nr:DUF1385 domain-containing protein [Clostridia bacterium]
MLSKNQEGSCSMKKTSIGGQALIEGIMMRGPKLSAMAVRNPEGEIVLETWETASSFGAKIFKLPFIRGIFNFIDSMRSGYKCLMRSAEIAGLEDEAPASDGKESKGISAAAMNALMVLSALLGVLLAIGLFIYLPAQLYSWTAKAIPVLDGNRFLRSLCEGVLRIAIFLGYMLLMTLMKDIRRTFQYHGAEHKTIFCYEKGLPLTVENVRKQSRFHPRCGTSFMILMLIVGIFVSMLINPEINAFLRTGIKLLTLPLIVGIGYELIKLAGRRDNWLTRAISAPGKWMQRITVLEPTDDMIECAIAAFREVIPEDERSDNW